MLEAAFCKTRCLCAADGQALELFRDEMKQPSLDMAADGEHHQRAVAVPIVCGRRELARYGDTSCSRGPCEPVLEPAQVADLQDCCRLTWLSKAAAISGCPPPRPGWRQLPYIEVLSSITRQDVRGLPEVSAACLTFVP